MDSIEIKQLSFDVNLFVKLIKVNVNFHYCFHYYARCLYVMYSYVNHLYVDHYDYLYAEHLYVEY